MILDVERLSNEAMENGNGSPVVLQSGVTLTEMLLSAGPKTGIKTMFNPWC
jgi:hypothetical protein